MWPNSFGQRVTHKKHQKTKSGVWIKQQFQPQAMRICQTVFLIWSRDAVSAPARQNGQKKRKKGKLLDVKPLTRFCKRFLVDSFGIAKFKSKKR